MGRLDHCFYFSMSEIFPTKKLKRNLIKPPKFHMIVTGPHPLGLLPVSLSPAPLTLFLPQALCTYCSGMVWFWSVPPKAHVLNTWSPVCGASGMWWRWGLVEGSLLGTCPWRGQWDPVSFPCHHLVNSVTTPRTPAMVFHLITRPKIMEPANHELKSVKPQDKISPSSF